MSPAAMDGTPAGGSAAASVPTPATEAAAPPGEQSSLAGVLERADALAVASPADAEPLYRRIIDGESDLVVTPADDVNAIKQAAIIGALPCAGVRERDLLRTCFTLRVLFKSFTSQRRLSPWCATGRLSTVSWAAVPADFFYSCVSLRLGCLY